MSTSNRAQHTLTMGWRLRRWRAPVSGQQQTSSGEALGRLKSRARKGVWFSPGRVSGCTKAGNAKEDRIVGVCKQHDYGPRKSNWKRLGPIGLLRKVAGCDINIFLTSMACFLICQKLNTGDYTTQSSLTQGRGGTVGINGNMSHFSRKDWSWRRQTFPS